MKTVFNEIKMAVFFYIISLVIITVLMTLFFLVSGFPTIGVYLTAHAIVYSYTLYRGWHRGAWKVLVEKKSLTREEKEDMFDI